MAAGVVRQLILGGPGMARALLRLMRGDVQLLQ